MPLFKRKPKNRRLSRAHVLDVKLRSDQVRRTRVRMTAIALGLVFGTVFGLYLFWRAGEAALDCLVYENTTFSIQEIETQTDGVIAPDQIRRWAGVKRGENLLALDLTRVQRDLELVPVIRSAAVDRVLPHTLRLRVTEREAVAQVRVPQPRSDGSVGWSVLHLDEEGYVMTLLDPRQLAAPPAETNYALPEIIGINPRELLSGRRIESLQARSALQLVNAFERSTISSFTDLRVIDVSSPEILEVTTGQGSRVTFAIRDLDRQLRRWRGIFEEGQKMGRTLNTLDLSLPNNLPATWLEASATPPPGPQIKPYQRNRKKNV
jgi:cell division septal protein FtsQ